MTSDLHSQARSFAKELQDALNGTICRDVRIGAVVRSLSGAGTAMTIGSGLSKSNPTQPTGFPLRVDGKRPRAWMNLSFQVRMDDELTYLTIHSSYCGIFADEELENCLCHFDFEREKERYTSAHLQVHGHSPALALLNRGNDSKRTLDKLHFPVGGKRFRPSLEDIIEFLIAERLVDAKAGYEEVLELGRERFQVKQLRAAMRRRPEIVEQFMKEQSTA
ncbi:hypothetical protein [Streptomyces sp900116325]|uniref:hypothetical protein n=1 Tax=Streptomyces sp. 900116325 TaxID=3154295 RepID=UPI0033D9BFF2